MKENQLKGTPVANGYAFGKSYEFTEPDLSVNCYSIDNSMYEISRFRDSLQQTKTDLQTFRQKVSKEQGEENARIFDAHILVLDDPEFISAIETNINKNKMNAEYALDVEANKFITLFEQLDDAYIRERVSDIKDVKRRILSHLLHKSLPNLSVINEPTILITHDLTPSDTAQINTKYIKGFITNTGGRTSHSSIMARTLGIPAIVGVTSATTTIQHGEEIIMDGMRGDIFINPSSVTKQKYIHLREEYDNKQQQWKSFKDKPSLSLDQHHVEIVANIGSYRDIDSVLDNGAEGIGLYRTEFLYMENHDFPTEEEQFSAYKRVLEQMNNKPVVIRTVDIGGDKTLNYWNLPEETNPFLGERAIRLALNHKDVFRTQLRALLRASHYGTLKVMFPMIATLEEFWEAKEMLLNEREYLEKAGHQIAKDIEVGMMVEVPATAMMASQFAKEVDFFSIGTNDLIQYTFAADRMNEAVSYLYQPFHPAILKLVKMVIDAAHAENKWVGMCGEMAGEPTAIPFLLGLGLDELSMSPSSILPARSQISSLKKKDMEKLASKALTLKTSEEVYQLVQPFTHH